MRNKRGEIPSEAMHLAIHLESVDIGAGVHGTEFLGTEFAATLVVEDQNRLLEIDPVTGEPTLFAPLPGTILRPVDEFPLDALCHLAEQIHTANKQLLNAQAILAGGRAGGFHDLYDVYGDEEDGPCEPIAYNSNGDHIFEEDRADHVRSCGIVREDVLIGNEEQIFYTGEIDYERRIIFLPPLIKPVLDCPSLSFKRALESQANDTYPGEEPWAVVIMGSDEPTIAAARHQQFHLGGLIRISPTKFTVESENFPTSSPTLKVRPEVIGVSFCPVGRARKIDGFDRIPAEFIGAPGAGRREAIVIIPGIYWPAIATNPQLSRSMAQAIAGLNCYTTGRLPPPERVTFVLKEALWNEHLDVADPPEGWDTPWDEGKRDPSTPLVGAYIEGARGMLKRYPPESYWS